MKVDPQQRTDVSTLLREAIRSGRFMPNERLIEANLAALFGTNRANVRTALARLEQEGLVVHEHNRGARVRLVSDEEALEITLVRGALEALVARQAAERAGPADFARLKTILGKMRDAYGSQDLAMFSQMNGQLHREMQQIAANATVTRFLESLLFPIVRFQYRAIFLPGRAEQSLSEHAAVVEAISENDPDGAEAAMRRHSKGVKDALRRSIALGKAWD
jgi:DNA-binding GntR family transcriptional regulator